MRVTMDYDGRLRRIRDDLEQLEADLRRRRGFNACRAANRIQDALSSLDDASYSAHELDTNDARRKVSGGQS